MAAINGGAGSGTQYFAGTHGRPDVIGDLDDHDPGRHGQSVRSVGQLDRRRPTRRPARRKARGRDATLTGGADPADNTDVVAYYLTVATGGASGAAKIAVTSDTAGENGAAATVTSGTPFTVGTKGLTLTPTFDWQSRRRPGVDGVADAAGPLPRPDLGQLPEHHARTCTRTASCTTMPGAFGTFEITAQAGNYATVKWTFTGTYVEAADDPNPAPIFERSCPARSKLARLQVGEFQAIVEKFTFNQMNDIQIRPDVSVARTATTATRIRRRKPEGGINPEADLVANNDFWGQFAAATTHAVPDARRHRRRQHGVVARARTRSTAG